MKHVFTVHSPITLLCALGVINVTKIPLSDVLILSRAGNFKLREIKVVELNSNSNILNKGSNLMASGKIDQLLEKLVGQDSFIAYVDLLTLDNRLLITHEKCQSFNILEEGAQTYFDTDNLNTITHDYKAFRFRIQGINDLLKQLKLTFTNLLRGYSRKIMGMPYHARGYIGFSETHYFVFDIKYALPGVDRSKLVELPLSNSFLTPRRLIPDNSIVFIEDSYCRSYCGNNLLYFDALNKFSARIFDIATGKKIFIKLRPGQDHNDSMVIKFLHHNSVQFEVLPKDIFLEMEFVVSKKLILIGGVSMLLFYGSKLGHESYSVFQAFPSLPHTAYQYNLSSFWKRVKQL